MSIPTIKFYYKKTKRPKLLENNVFVLYSPQKLKFEPGEKKTVNMRIKINFPATTTGSCRLLFGLSNCGLHLLNGANLTGDTYLHFEILNSNFTDRLQINNRQDWVFCCKQHSDRNKIPICKRIVLFTLNLQDILRYFKIFQDKL